MVARADGKPVILPYREQEGRAKLGRRMPSFLREIDVGADFPHSIEHAR
jgi:hypothetical protein